LHAFRTCTAFSTKKTNVARIIGYQNIIAFPEGTCSSPRESMNVNQGRWRLNQKNLEGPNEYSVLNGSSKTIVCCLTQYPQIEFFRPKRNFHFFPEPWRIGKRGTAGHNLGLAHNVDHAFVRFNLSDMTIEKIHFSNEISYKSVCWTKI